MGIKSDGKSGMDGSMGLTLSKVCEWFKMAAFSNIYMIVAGGGGVDVVISFSLLKLGMAIPTMTEIITRTNATIHEIHISIWFLGSCSFICRQLRYGLHVHIF